MTQPNSTAQPLVAALFVQTGGVYFGLDGVEPWDEERDAMLYDGPWPVVAHPPCARWSRLAGFTEARFGYKRGEDGGRFESALRSVRRFGGVLEHPAHSAAWVRYELPKPITADGWTLDFDGGASCYVEQGRYGLPVKKATWLYAYGVDLPDLRWGCVPDGRGEQPNGPHGGIDNWRDRWAKPTGLEDPNSWWKTHRHDGMRSATPPEFRDVLIAMARTADVAVAA